MPNTAYQIGVYQASSADMPHLVVLWLPGVEECVTAPFASLDEARRYAEKLGAKMKTMEP